MNDKNLENLGSAGEHGTKIDEKNLAKYLVKGYLPTIGIECHVQLATKTKLFSSVDNDARGSEPNSKVSAIDYALPGMLPYLNREAIVFAARAGKALNSRIANISRFDRKHYFYPDLPKGYQISQMYQPIILGGFVELPPEKSGESGEKIRIHHAHLEEDAGKLTHFSDYSLVDLNRAGTPLIEIVGEPDIHSAKMARAYAEELHALMTFARVTFGDLYYGNMRFDVNISVAKPNAKKLGLRTEIKNLNSFRAVEKASEYEIFRQIEILESGEKVAQETRGWSDAEQKTFSQRSKEDAQDYRYMPDADIPPVVLTDEEIAKMQENMPTLPPEFREKFAILNLDDSVLGVILSAQNLAEKLLEVLLNSAKKFDEKSAEKFAKNIANLFASSFNFENSENENREIDENLQNSRENFDEKSDNFDENSAKKSDEKSREKDDLPSAENLIELAKMFAESEISSTAQKEIFAEMLKNAELNAKKSEKSGEKSAEKIGNSAKKLSENPREIATAKNLLQNSNSDEISQIVDEVLASETCKKAVQDFKNGEEKVIGFLVGQVMKASKGKANPTLAQKLIREKLK